jgi:hypothetical protein
VAWYALERDASMYFICNFLWGARGDWRWDGHQVGKIRSEIKVKRVEPGKGSGDPILSGPVANNLTTEKKSVTK